MRLTVLLVSAVPCATAWSQVTTDDCANATVALVGNGLIQWDNRQATTGSEGQNEASCTWLGATGIENDVWTIFTPVATGCAIVSTCFPVGSITSTKIAVYSGTGCPTPGSALACNDDNCGQRARMSFPVVAGQNYLLQLGNDPGRTPGTGEVNVFVNGATPPRLTDQDDCSNGDVDDVGPGRYLASTLAATTGTQGQNETSCAVGATCAIENDVWFTYTATRDGCAVIFTCQDIGGCATFTDTKLAVWNGAGCPVDGTSLACSDDGCNGRQSLVAFPIVHGTSYLVQLGNPPGEAPGTALVEIDEIDASTPLTNQDDCSNAAIDTIGPGRYRWNNLGASRGPEGQSEPLCYSFGGSAIYSDIWATYVPEVDGSTTIETCGPIGPNADTKIAAYPSAPCSSIDSTAVACNDDGCGPMSRITFDVLCGESYLLQLGTFSTESDGLAPLVITESGSACGPGPIGSTPAACDPAQPNSTGSPGTIRAEGSTSAAAMDVTVFAESLPPGQFGFFFASQSLGFVPMPGGSSGDICVVGNQGRYDAAGQIGLGPSFSLRVGDILVPTNPAGQPLLTGETWYWQAWHRDSGGSNFTNVVGITFE